MIVENFLAAQVALVEDFVNPPGLGPSCADRKMHRLGNGENPHLAKFDTKGGLVSQTGFQLSADLFEGNFKRAGRKEGQVAASLTSRLYFLAEAFDETSHRLRNVSHQ
jgi:hypothetical protein